MQNSRQWFEPVAVTINAARTGQPITKLIFGGLMEPAPGRGSFSFGPPAAMTENSLPQPPRRITVPPSSMTVYAFEVR